MIVQIGDKQVKLVPRDVRAAKKMINQLIDTADAAAKEKNANLFKYTLLVVMYVMSKDYIESLTPEVLQFILDASAKNEEVRKLLEQTGTQQQS